MKVIVYHGGYGCATGCCGHWIDFGENEKFAFDHRDKDETVRDFVESILREKHSSEHLADIDWENCMILTYEECPTYGW